MGVQGFGLQDDFLFGNTEAFQVSDKNHCRFGRSFIVKGPIAVKEQLLNPAFPIKPYRFNQPFGIFKYLGFCPLWDYNPRILPVLGHTHKPHRNPEM
ncbi:MAG: hypothetical protein A2Y40_08655 [Candidatus Margulisbacteria bacterium GWF2_35_9]|nr:MAG: hypothetical protein A2Y40_08655 [Candidatus Margulisbacteria bacterium GWF2_35_9]